MKIKIRLFLITILLIINNCGFKVLDKSEINNFSIREIRSSGELRVNHKIKNDILINSKKSSKNQIVINLNTKKIKSIKERNIKNEIIKYQIILKSNVKFFSMNDDIKGNFSKSVTGDYTPGNTYSTSINNEKKVIDNLIENLSEKILDEIASISNDL